MLADAALFQTDPVAFARALGLHPDPVQQRLLASRSRRILLNCCRQWGKSTFTAALLTHRLLFGSPDALAITISPSLRQTGEFFLKVSTFLERLNFEARGDGHNRHSLVFPNRARLVGVPRTEATLRGFSAVSYLVFEEAARVPDSAWLAARPMLATVDATILALSTPYGKRGFFYEQWVRGGSTWERYHVPATEAAHLTPSFLEEERRSVPASFFRQDYLCEFTDLGGVTFPEEWIARTVSKEHKPLCQL